MSHVVVGVFIATFFLVIIFGVMIHNAYVDQRERDEEDR